MDDFMPKRQRNGCAVCLRYFLAVTNVVFIVRFTLIHRIMLNDPKLPLTTTCRGFAVQRAIGYSSSTWNRNFRANLQQSVQRVHTKSKGCCMTC